MTRAVYIKAQEVFDTIAAVLSDPNANDADICAAVIALRASAEMIARPRGIFVEDAEVQHFIELTTMARAGS